jgi:hypothetical protein
MKSKQALAGLLAAALGLAAGVGDAQGRFGEGPGAVKFGEVKKGGALELPCLPGGADLATILANGGRTTRPDSIYGRMGLRLELVDGSDFRAQVRHYVSGRSAFVRGTFGVLGHASEALNTDARTKPVVFLQLAWSAGAHLVARAGCRTLNDLKGKKVALAEGGPHAGLLDDALRAAGLKWQDVTAVWTGQAAGPGGPAGKFRADASVDVCLVGTRDMQGLTGEPGGTGAGKAAPGAHVLVSAAHLKRSLADVCAVRKDFHDANGEVVKKLAAGYLKGCEELLGLRARLGKDGAARARYRQVLGLGREVFGEDRAPGDEGPDRLTSDAVLVGLPGNRTFFQGKGNPGGFSAREKQALDLGAGRKHAARAGFLPARFDYGEVARLGGLKADIDQPPVPLPAGAELGEAVVTFALAFPPNEKGFPEERYGDDFQKAVRLAWLFGGCAVAIRGHADPTKVLREFVECGLADGSLTREGKPGRYRYYLAGGRRIDLDDPRSMRAVADLVKKGNYSGAPANPRVTLELCDRLSRDRADQVHQSLLKYAAARGLTLDRNQLRRVGVGILDPVVPKPKNNGEAARNRRVEFRLHKVKGAAPAAGGLRFDY